MNFYNFTTLKKSLTRAEYSLASGLDTQKRCSKMLITFSFSVIAQIVYSKMEGKDKLDL